MRLKVDRKTITSVINRIDVIPSRTTLPILGNVLIVANEKSIVLSSTDLAIGISETCQAEVEEIGEITVPLKKLEDLLKITKTTEICLYTKGKSTLVIEGDGISTIKGIESAEFPPFPKIEKSNFLCEIEATTLKNALIKGSVGASTEESKVILNSVYFDFGEKLKLVSADEVKMSIETLDVSSSNKASIIVPLKAVGKINSLSGLIKIYYTEGTMFFITETILLFVKTIVGKYPSYELIMPTNIGTKITFSKDDFISFGKQALLFSDTKAVHLTLISENNETKLEMKSIGDEGENIGSFFINKILGDDQTFILNMNYALDGISVMSFKDIMFEYDRKNTPVLFRDSDDFIFIMAVMVSN